MAVTEKQILDDLNGYEFEELMVDVFRKMGYDDVKVSKKTGDKGRDIIMEGDSGNVVVECKHQDKVGRPVVQKLHSAVSTFENCRKGIVATTGRLTNPAQEYADTVSKDGKEEIELVDGQNLRDIGESIGLDLYSGKIEVICNESLSYPGQEEIRDRVTHELDDVENFTDNQIDSIDVEAAFTPSFCVDARIDSTFETSVGVISEVHERDKILFTAQRSGPTTMNEQVGGLVSQNLDGTREIDTDELGDEFSDAEVRRFGRTETEYQDWVVDKEQDRYSHTVRYTGDNNVTYTKECTPNKSDVEIRDVKPFYLPKIKSQASIKRYNYGYECYTAGSDILVDRNDLSQCVHCGSDQGKITFCENCGSLNCSSHIKTERLEKEPVCTGCAVTDQFFLKEKYFYTQQNRDEFQQIYRAMPLYKKPLENKPLTAGAILAILSVTTWMAVNTPLF